MMKHCVSCSLNLLNLEGEMKDVKDELWFHHTKT